MIPNALLVMNGKGGVGKTSLVANLGGLAAENDWRVLLIDTDPQGNLARDLGVLERSDDGRNLADAVLGRTALSPLSDVRPNLDLAAGGPCLDSLPGEVQAVMTQGRYLAALSMLERAVAPIAGRYDLIIIDSPPGDRALQTLAARAAHHLVIPTAPDDCSIDGLAAVFDRYQHLKTEGGNPDLTILGVALTLAVSSATAVQRRARIALAELLGSDGTVFTTAIRFAQAAAVDCRRSGRLAHEYEAAAETAPGWWTRPPGADPVPRYSTAAGGLAADYHALVDEILAACVQHATGTATPVRGRAA